MLIDDGLLPEDFASGHKLELDEDNQHCYTRFRRKYLKFKAHLFRLDFQLEQDGAKHSCGRWPAVTLLWFYCYCTAKLSIATYYHFVFDYHRYKLDKFDQLWLQTSDHDRLSSAQIGHREQVRQQLVREYQEARQVLKRIGSPYLNFPFIAGMAKMALILSISVSYQLMQLYYRLWKPFDYNIVYTLLAPESLQPATDRIIREQVNRFIVSCRTYNEQLIDQETSEAVLMQWQKELLRGEFRSAKRKATRPDASSDSDSEEMDNDYFEEHVIHKDSLMIKALVSRIVTSHKFLVQQVRSMAAGGMFQPFNRRRDWLLKLSVAHSLTELMSLSSVAMWLVFLMLILPFTRLLYYELETDPMDLIFHTELCLYGAVGMSTGTFYLSLTAMICLDQVHIVSRLNELIKSTILDNTYKLKDFLDDEIRVYRSPFSKKRFSLDEFTQTSVLRSPIRNIRFVPTRSVASASTALSITGCDEFMASLPRAAAGRHCIDPYIDKSINLSLMHALMHYKIFVTQLKPALDSLPVFATFILLLTFLLPAMTRLLIAYLDASRKGASLLFCLLILTTSDLAFVMIDRLHARCMIIYRHLQSLMAHIVAMDHIVKLRTGREAYDKHLVWILRKELNHPERLTDQFATRLILVQSTMTYASLMKYHFWWGVMTISIVVIDPSLPNASDIFGGVWRFYGFADAHVKSLMNVPAGNLTLA